MVISSMNGTDQGLPFNNIRGSLRKRNEWLKLCSQVIDFVHKEGDGEVNAHAPKIGLNA